MIYDSWYAICIAVVLLVCLVLMYVEYRVRDFIKNEDFYKKLTNIDNFTVRAVKDCRKELNELEARLSVERDVICAETSKKFAILHSKFTDIQRMLSPTTSADIEKETQSPVLHKPKWTFTEIEKKTILAMYDDECKKDKPNFDELVTRLNKKLGIRKAKRAYQGIWGQPRNERP